MNGREIVAFLTSDEGRTGLRAYWLFIAATCLLALLLILIPAFRASSLALALFRLALLYPCYSVIARRLQDCGVDGAWAVPVVGIAAVDILSATPMLHHLMTGVPLVARLWWWVSLADVAALLAIGLVPGNAGPNRFGPAP